MTIKLSSICKLRNVPLYIFSAMGMIFSSGAYAACALKPTLETFSFNFGTVTVQRDTPIGTQISNTPTVTAGAVGMCDVPTNFQSLIGPLFPTPSGIVNFYDTNIPGVAIGIFASSFGPFPSLVPLPVSNSVGPIFYSARLIKTGPTGAGILSSGTVGRVAYQNLRYIADLNLVGTTVQTVACSVSNTNIVVPMGAVNRTLFTGVGTPVAERDFEVPLDCDAQTKINITIDGVADGSGVAGVLALDASGTGTVASGIGLQVLHGGAPITLGIPVPIGTAASAGGYMVSLTARYLQNAPAVTAGQANSTATFTMTYN